MDKLAEFFSISGYLDRLNTAQIDSQRSLSSEIKSLIVR